jgi:hypothetical protein
MDNFDHQNPSKNSSLVSMLLHHITIESFTHEKIYMKVHGIHTH